MGVVDTLKGLVGPDAALEQQTEWTGGSFWCTECEGRVPGHEVPEGEEPSCPECGAAMTFEKGGPSHCAC